MNNRKYLSVKTQNQVQSLAPKTQQRKLMIAISDQLPSQTLSKIPIRRVFCVIHPQVGPDCLCRYQPRQSTLALMLRRSRLAGGIL